MASSNLPCGGRNRKRCVWSAPPSPLGWQDAVFQRSDCPVNEDSVSPMEATSLAVSPKLLNCLDRAPPDLIHKKGSANGVPLQERSGKSPMLEKSL